MNKRTLLFALLALAGCASDADVLDEHSGEEVVADAPEHSGEAIAGADQALGARTITVSGSPAPQLGDGYNSVTESLKRRCVSAGVKQGSALNVGAVTFSRAMTQTETESALGISGAAKVSFGVIGINGSTSFARWTQASSRSVNMSYRAAAIVRTDSLVTTPVSPLIAQASWQNECGDQYVREISYGGELFVTLRIDFATEAERSAFQANVGGNWLWNEVKAKYSNAARSFKGRATITLEAFQRGGRPEELTRVVGAGAITCSFDDLQGCDRFMNAVNTYAQGAFSTNLRSFPAALSYTVDDWSTLGLGAAAQDVPASIKSARTSLLTMYRQQVEIVNRYEKLIQSPYYVATPKSFQDRAGLFAFAALSNINLLLNTVPYCFDKLSLPVKQDEGSLCVWFAAPAVLTQSGFTDVSGAMAAMDVKLQPIAGAERFDLVAYKTAGEGHFGDWTPYKMCPTGTFAIGYRQSIEGWLGEGRDDTGLNTIELLCGHPTNRSLVAFTRRTPHAGFWGTWFPEAVCPLGPMNGMRIDIEPRQFDGDDTAAVNVAGSCLTGEQFNAGQDSNLTRFGQQGAMTYCPGGTAVCGIKIRIEADQKSGDDTAMNGLAFACCAL